MILGVCDGILRRRAALQAGGSPLTFVFSRFGEPILILVTHR